MGFSDWIVEEMRTLDPKYATRGPAHTKARRQRRLEDASQPQPMIPRSEEPDEDSDAGYDPPEDYPQTDDISETHPGSVPPAHSALPGIALPEILAAVERSTPQMVSLYQMLHNFPGGRYSTLSETDHNSLLKCMEAAAMLERQLARVASSR